MEKYVFSLFILGDIFCPSRNLIAQTSRESFYVPTVLTPVDKVGFYLGVVGGANFVKYTTNVYATQSSEPTCSVAQDGYGISPCFGITAEIPISYAHQGFLILETLYDSKSAKFNIINSDPHCPELTTEYSATLAYLDVNAGFKYNFIEAPVPRGPGIQVAVNFGMRVADSYFKRIVGSLGSYTLQGHFSDMERIRIGLRGQIMYDIPLSSSFGFRPLIGYDYPFTRVDQDRTWTAESSYGEIAFIFLIR